jgi:hypothetical protein
MVVLAESEASVAASVEAALFEIVELSSSWVIAFTKLIIIRVTIEAH